MSADWKSWNHGFPYKGSGYSFLTNPQYLQDRDELFQKNGNGWWWDDDRWTKKGGLTNRLMRDKRKYRRS